MILSVFHYTQYKRSTNSISTIHLIFLNSSDRAPHGHLARYRGGERLARNWKRASCPLLPYRGRLHLRTDTPCTARRLYHGSGRACHGRSRKGRSFHFTRSIQGFLNRHLGGALTGKAAILAAFNNLITFASENRLFNHSFEHHAVRSVRTDSVRPPLDPSFQQPFPTRYPCSPSDLQVA